jgi:lysophospholipase L1-like esterase
VSVDLASVFANNYSVSIDGGAPTIKTQADGTSRTTVSLAAGLAAGDHTVQITRNNSYFDGATTFYGFTFGGGTGLLAPASYTSSLRLEVYGDSIGAAGGINSSACGSITDSENAYLGYAHLATRTLGAQAPTLIAASGHGIFHGYLDNSGVRAVPNGIYNKTLYDEGLTWPFTGTAPNVVLIALGTNDSSNCPDLGRDPTNGELQTAYANFASTLRTKYPSAAIVFTVGPMNYLYQTAALAAKAQRIALGDSNVYSLIHSTQTLNGCAGHPAYAEHAVMASDLVTFLHTLGY